MNDSAHHPPAMRRSPLAEQAAVSKVIRGLLGYCEGQLELLKPDQAAVLDYAAARADLKAARLSLIDAQRSLERVEANMHGNTIAPSLDRCNVEPPLFPQPIRNGSPSPGTQGKPPP